MKNIRQRTTAIAAAFLLVTLSLALGAQSAEGGARHITIAGRVLKVDLKERTMLVKDKSSGKLYLIITPPDATFQITFGAHMQLTQPRIEDVQKNNRVRVLAKASERDRLAVLEDGRQVRVLTAAP